MKNLDAWTAHIKDPKDRNKFAEYVRNSTDLLGRLTEIIDMKLTIAKRSTKTDYESPGWAYRQADQNGTIRTLEDLRKLTNIGD
jgi:hypothetical protein|tara:strand:+ start:479 stop:730 length:252 start_codon:yes stop_codon:yes gene_type:complete